MNSAVVNFELDDHIRRSRGALCGQLAGSFYGVEAIPNNWIEKLVMGQEIGEIAEDLAQASWDDR